jgi:HSP20 family protein
MFDEWDIIPRKYRFGNFFGDIDMEFSQAEEMLSRILNTARGIDPSTKNLFRDAATFPFYYRSQITVSTEGKPQIRNFENVKPSVRRVIEQPNIREPFVDILVDEKNNSLVITAEMPGISKEDIRVNVSSNLIVLHGEKGNKKYHTEIPVETDLDDSSARAHYTNGILDLKLKLKEHLKSNGRDINIE